MLLSLREKPSNGVAWRSGAEWWSPGGLAGLDAEVVVDWVEGCGGAEAGLEVSSIRFATPTEVAYGWLSINGPILVP